MTDLTKINVPFGLLDEETREALMKHGGPYQKLEASSASDNFVKWVDVFPYNGFMPFLHLGVYRVNPAPREWWLVNGYKAFGSKEEAEKYRSASFPGAKIYHVREVKD